MAGWLIWLVPALAAWVTEEDRKDKAAANISRVSTSSADHAKPPKPETSTDAPRPPR
jgi:hypothetical protein